jgi:hypothetical protein
MDEKKEVYKSNGKGYAPLSIAMKNGIPPG